MDHSIRHVGSHEYLHKTRTPKSYDRWFEVIGRAVVAGRNSSVFVTSSDRLLRGGCGANLNQPRLQKYSAS